MCLLSRLYWRCSKLHSIKYRNTCSRAEGREEEGEEWQGKEGAKEEEGRARRRCKFYFNPEMADAE